MPGKFSLVLWATAGLLAAAAAQAQVSKQSTQVVRSAFIPDCGDKPGPDLCREAPAFLYAEAERRLGGDHLTYWIDGQTLNIAARTQTAEARLTGTFQEGLQPMSTVGSLWGATYRVPQIARSVIEMGLEGVQVRPLVYRGPQAPLAPPSNTVLKGRAETVEINSVALGHVRKVEIYIPPGSAPKGGWPLLIAANGEDIGRYLGVIDALIEQRQIQPVAVAAIWSGSSSGEYLRVKDPDAWGRHAMFVQREVMPMLETRFGATRNPAQKMLFGVGNGGDWAVQAALRDPSMARHVAALSVSGLSEPPFRSGRNLHLYMAAGAYEGTYLRGSRQICALASASGTPCVLEVTASGHAPLIWETQLAKALKAVFPVSRR